jgi:hypothetical protein
MFYNIYGISDIVSYFNMINDSIISKYGTSKIRIEKYRKI